MTSTMKTYPIRSRLFRAICMDPDPRQLTTEYYEGGWWEQNMAADERFLARLPADLSFEGRSVLDYGCGTGQTCVIVAQRGARRVLGVDLQEVDFARSQLEGRYSELADRVEFRQIASAADIGEERFDLVLSKNTMEHVADPEGYVSDMAGLLAPGGQLVIGFNPLWKSPYGAHIHFMTKVPWAHLMFPEEVVLRERRRFRPDEDPSCYEEIKAGLNRMTLAKFRAVMAKSGLEPTYFEVNRNERAVAKVLNAFSRVPGLREYFAFSVHSMWRRSES
jgi:2-polyprenyl-3-methyl-5-hydroxy-6-metoxy-1,4-benzoquinol methylase